MGVKVLATKPDNLSLTLSTHMVCTVANAYTQKQISLLKKSEDSFKATFLGSDINGTWQIGLPSQGR